jgi:hypothetical protein
MDTIYSLCGTLHYSSGMFLTGDQIVFHNQFQTGRDVGMHWPWAWQQTFYLHSGCWIGEFQKTTSHTDDVIQKNKMARSSLLNSADLKHNF